MHAPSDVYERRLSAAQQAAADAGIDALLITPGADLRYLTGYDAKALERLTCLIVRADADPVLLLPGLERAAALASPVGTLDLELHVSGETDDAIAVAGALCGPARRIGVDDRMWAQRVLGLIATLPQAGFVAAGAVTRALRLRKDDAEIAALVEAGAAIDRVHADVPDLLRPGRTEREVGRLIAERILAEGHDSVDFVIVGSGPNSASPHHELSDRTIAPGDVVVVDIGGTMPSGYCSDSTRTYVVGEPPAGFVERYEALQRAQAAACALVRPGVTCGQVDAAAREVLTEAGLGEWFIHRTGHGIGLETHEDPYLFDGNDQVVEPGMAFSVEPGFYLPDEVGARIEDILVVTETGSMSLNTRPHALLRVPAR